MQHPAGGLRPRVDLSGRAVAAPSGGAAAAPPALPEVTPVAIRSHGEGHVDGDGTLVLDQSVQEDGAAPKRREWRLREDRSGHCTGTVSDGLGPVDGTLVGNQLHLRYKLKGGLNIEQWLSFDPGGRSASNRITVRKLGFSVASLNETIRKAD